MAAMLLGGLRVWPGVAIGAFAANATTDAPITVALFTTLGNPLEAVVAASLLRRGRRFDLSLEPVRDVVTFTLSGVVVAPMTAATVGVAGLHFAGVISASGAPAAWFTWWAGDAMGILLVTPLLLAWYVRPLGRVPASRVVEGAALAVLTGAAAVLVFGRFLRAGSLPRSSTSPSPF